MGQNEEGGRWDGTCVCLVCVCWPSLLRSPPPPSQRKSRDCSHCLVTKSRLTVCSPRDCSRPGSPVLHYLLEFAQIHVHCVRDAIQPSYLLSPPSPFAFKLSQHQGLFQWVGSSHQVAEVLVLQLQLLHFQRIFRADFLQGWLVWSPCCQKDSQEYSPAPKFESINSLALSSLWSNSHIIPNPASLCLPLRRTQETGTVEEQKPWFPGGSCSRYPLEDEICKSSYKFLRTTCFCASHQRRQQWLLVTDSAGCSVLHFPALPVVVKPPNSNTWNP